MNSKTDKRYSQIGIDRLVRLEWLQYTASLSLAGNKESVMKSLLQDHLKDSFESTDTSIRSSMDKTITILRKTWDNVPGFLLPLKNDGLSLLASSPKKYHIAIHWGMISAVYPFWGAVAANVGRLIKLQGSAAAVQVQRRLKEQYGERETVSRRVRYILRSFVEWGVIVETAAQGIYAGKNPLTVDNEALITWLIEAYLYSIPSGASNFRDLIGKSSLFPFSLHMVSSDRLANYSDRLDIVRHGFDETLIILKK
jgi:hypothetical protein